jgi:hypothetical protein
VHDSGIHSGAAGRVGARSDRYDRNALEGDSSSNWHGGSAVFQQGDSGGDGDVASGAA